MKKKEFSRINNFLLLIQVSKKVINKLVNYFLKNFINFFRSC